MPYAPSVPSGPEGPNPNALLGRAEPLASRQDQPAATRRDEILDGAAELFAEYGYHGASLRNISSRVGISHPGMLHHFASKDALLDGVIDRLEAHAQAALDRVDELCTDSSTFVRALAEIWHPGSHGIQLLATLDADAVSDDHPGRFRMARLRRVHEYILEHCFTHLEELGVLRKDVDAAFAARVMLALVLSHAVRENTVRVMQTKSHDDAPVQDLIRLARVLLVPDPPVEQQPHSDVSAEEAPPAQRV